MKRRLWILWFSFCFYLALGWWLTAFIAHAGPGGSIAMPGPCDYPFIGHQVYAAGGGWWRCDGPVEENCSHWHIEGKDWNAGGPTGSGDYSINFMGFGIGIPGGIIGGGDGWQGYLYPDDTAAPWPNPPGAWKAFLVPKCPREHNHAPNPPPEPHEQNGDVAPPSSDPAPPPLTGAVTNPDRPNPDATQNPQ